MAEKGSRHVSRKGADDKRQGTAALSETLSGEILPFQLICHGKGKRSIPSSKFPAGFLLRANPRHWSNEEEPIKLLDGVIKPYGEKTKAELGLEDSRKARIIWDAFKGQDTPEVKSKLQELTIRGRSTKKHDPLVTTIGSHYSQLGERYRETRIQLPTLRRPSFQLYREILILTSQLLKSILSCQH